MKPGATELGERRAVTPRLSCEIPSDVCYCKYAEALYVCLAGGRDSREVELTVGWQSQGVELARVELSGRWNSLAGDSNMEMYIYIYIYIYIFIYWVHMSPRRA